jgi:zinc transport system substrate-binding protein
VNEPLAFFARRIGGEAVDVRFPAPPDVDPAHWSPDPETVAAYQEADVILLNGAGYAGWVARATLPGDALVDTSAGFADRLLPVEGAVSHQHGPAGEHSHAGTAFTTWLDPTLAVQQARAVADAIGKHRPERAGELAASLAGLEADLLELDARLAKAALTLAGAPILFSHPVYQYLQHRYGLNARSLHWEPDEAPDAKAWRGLEALLAEHPARLVLWEGAPLPETRARLEELGLRSVVFDPGGRRTDTGDWLALMQQNVQRLEAALAQAMEHTVRRERSA